MTSLFSIQIGIYWLKGVGVYDRNLLSLAYYRWLCPLGYSNAHLYLGPLSYKQCIRERDQCSIRAAKQSVGKPICHFPIYPIFTLPVRKSLTNMFPSLAAIPVIRKKNQFQYSRLQADAGRQFRSQESSNQLRFTILSCLQSFEWSSDDTWCSTPSFYGESC